MYVAADGRLLPWAIAPSAAAVEDALLITGAAPGVRPDLVRAAARFGVLAEPSLLCILGPDPEPCLCCCRVGGLAAADADAAIAEFLVWYDLCSYLSSRAMARFLAQLDRDLEPGEVAALRRSLAGSRFGPACDRVHALVPGLVIAVPACAPDRLWVYSTGAGRRLLRWIASRPPMGPPPGLGSAPPGLGGPAPGRVPVRVSVASSSGSVVPRTRLRMYEAVAVAGATGAAGGRTAPGWLAELALEWARRLAKKAAATPALATIKPAPSAPSRARTGGSRPRSGNGTR